MPWTISIVSSLAVPRRRARATYLRLVDRDLTGALAELQRALSLAPSDARVVSAIAVVESELGRFDDALRDFELATRLDPRASVPNATQTRVLLRLGRVAEARPVAARARALAPTSLTSIEAQILVEAAAGDLPAARRVVTDAARDVPTDALLADIGVAWDLGWVLDSGSARRLLALGPDAFDGDTTVMRIVRAQVLVWNGDSTHARATADSAVAGLRAELRVSPRDPQRTVILALILAHAGHRADALTTAAQGLALTDERPEARMSTRAAYLHYVAARAALLAGDRDRAIAWLTEARRRRYHASPAWIRLDPSWTSLRGDPRFERVLSDG